MVKPLGGGAVSNSQGIFTINCEEEVKSAGVSIYII